MIVVFAGTKDGRDWVMNQLNAGTSVVVSVATGYGAGLYPKHENLEVIHGRKDLGEIKQFIKDKAPEKVVDGTHPYAVEVTKNIRTVCMELQIPYERIQRETTLHGLDHPDIHTFDSYDALTASLEKSQGNILWTIGSNALAQVMKGSLLSRSYVRVLPTSQVIQKCEELGLGAGRIIGMQGPFSIEMNQIMYKDYQIRHMVTKDSGNIGGTLEKVLPALDMGIQVLVYERQKEEEGGIRP